MISALLTKISPMLRDGHFILLLGGTGGGGGEQLSCVYPWSLEVLLRQVSAAPGCGTSESSCCSCPPGEFPAHQLTLVRLSLHHYKTLRASTGLPEAQAQMTSLELPQLPPELCSSLLPHLPTEPFPSLPRPPALCCPGSGEYIFLMHSSDSVPPS